MADFASFTINDGETTPVAHEFVPNGKNGDLVTFEVDSGLTQEVNDRLTISWRKTPTNWVVRAVLSLPKPITETVNGVDRTKADSRAFADIKFTMPLTSTKQDRRNLLTLLANSLGNSGAGPIWNCCVRGEGIF